MPPKRFDDPAGAGSDDDSFESEEDTVAKGKKGKDKQVRRRSSKACDNCRKSKCKCARIIDPGTNQPVGPCQNCLTVGAECTYLGASRKRGPPKGYIEAIESRLHRMEALLGGLLANEDPRAAALLGELIGDDEAREVLTKDLRAASAAGPTSKPRKSWKKADEPSMPSPGPSRPQVSHGFSSHDVLTDSAPPLGSTPRPWFTDEDLSFPTGLQGIAGLDNSGAMPGMNFTGSSSNALGFDAGGPSYRGGRPDSDEESRTSPSLFHGVDIPVPSTSLSSVNGLGTMNPRHASGGSGSFSLSLPQHTSLIKEAVADSPRQRRRLNNQSPTIGTTSLFGVGPNPVPGALGFGTHVKQGLGPASINHTGQASYSLSVDAELSPAVDDEAGGMTELADVVGQLSLNENAEVRYHGRSSGLYLISKSARYKDFFWQFPSAGVWPPTDGRVLKTENEILQIAEAEDPLPDRHTQQHLLDLYWTYVHPHFPILYKVSFMRQYRHSMSNPNSTEPSTPAGSGKVPMVLLLSMFALAARYSDLDPPRSDGKYWTAGQTYLDKAKRVLNYDYGSSKLVSVQALLLMAYREIGTGGMSASWLFTGMAIRMAQDLGLFRDVEKWFLPVQRFSHEEKQTRKRVWWGCIILDRYTASYIGRPGTIHERDYDTSFPSEDEPDEHEQWRPLRPDGTDWSVPAKVDSDDPQVSLARYPPTKAYTLSCFNAAGALAVIINRIIANIYAIRTRVLGQSSETLLSLLDQSLASWYLALPPHLAYNPAAKKVPPPHILSLHLQFYSALILLHRPFIPGQNSQSSPNCFPSHSICTTSATAISKIVAVFTKTFTLRQCPPFLTYPIFSAAVICVYNAGFDDTLARSAKVHLAQCMAALKDMEVIWGSAIRQWELLHGLVDLRDADLGAELQAMDEDGLRGVKRQAESPSESTPLHPSTFSGIPPTNFHTRPLGRQATQTGAAKPRRRSTSATNRVKMEPRPSTLSGSPTIPEAFPLAPPHMPPPLFPQEQEQQGMFSHSVPSAMGHEGAHQTYEFLGANGPALDLSQFRSPPGTSGGVTNFSDLLNSFLSPTEAAADSSFRSADPMQLDPSTHGGMDTNAFFGFPMGAEITEDWATYLPQAFFSPDPTGVQSPETEAVHHPL